MFANTQRGDAFPKSVDKTLYKRDGLFARARLLEYKRVHHITQQSAAQNTSHNIGVAGAQTPALIFGAKVGGDEAAVSNGRWLPFAEQGRGVQRFASLRHHELGYRSLQKLDKLKSGLENVGA